MNWHSATEFFNMGGYGLYVWGSYAVSALIMAIEPWQAARRRQRAQLLSSQAESESS